MIADRGEQDPVPIFLERADQDGYSFRLGLKAGIGGQEVARIPVGKRINPDPHPILKEIHHCEVAGRVLEAANPYALRDKVGALLDSIAPSRSLPLAYFRVPAMDYVVPVYEDDGHIVSPVIGGPNLKSRDLGGIRREVCRYLVSTGYVHDPEEVTVGVMRPSDLSLVPPAAVIRSLADPEFWIPTVEGTSAEGPVVGVLGHAAQLRRARAPPRRRRSRRAGHGARRARGGVADQVRARGARADALGRRPRRAVCLRGAPGDLGRRRAAHEHSGSRLVAFLDDGESTRLELNIRRTGAGDFVVALEDRHINVFLAHSESALARQVGTYLTAGGFLRFADEVEIHAAQAPRAERLETDSIWTFTEEVQSTWS